MSIARICQKNIDTAALEESVRVAAQRMSTRSVGMLMVLDEARRPIGVLTDRDIALRVVGEGHDPAAFTVAEVMTPQPKVVSELASLEDALTLMRTHGVRRLPVVAPAGGVVGVLSLDDVLAQLAEDLWQMGRVIRKSSPQVLAVP